MIEGMDGMMEALRQLGEASDESKKLTSLDAIIQVLEDQDDDLEKNTRLFLDGGIMTVLLPLLAPPGDCAGKAAQVVAEITKTEDARGPCVQAGLVSPLLRLLKDDHRVQCQIQAGRALGNICYENDSGRHMVDSENGVEILLQLLRSQLDQSADGAARLRLVGCGFLLNLANTQESIQEKALNLGVLDVLDDYLKKHNSDDGICQMVLLTIGCLSDSALGQEKLCTCDLPVTIVRLLGSGVSSELQEACLDLLANLAENDGVKVQLARSELKNGSLLSLLETTSKVTCESEENLQLEKLVADLVVLLLTGDESMELLYAEGKGVIFEQVLRWIQSSKEHLRSSGVLAIGNFARNDSHCKQLVKSGITEQLVATLQEQAARGDTADNPALLHAIFSALRNLAIPAVNKPLMLKCGLIDGVLPHLKVDLAAVQFKLLGTLRMIIDGQDSAAVTLGTNESLLQQLMEWCKVEEHAGVKGEACRLVASLVKHSRSSMVMKSIISHGGIVPLVSMATSEHVMMQNEALVALTMISVSILGDATAALVDSELVPTLQSMLSSDKTQLEILCNTLTLARNIAMSNELKQQLVAAEVPVIAKNLQSHSEAKVQTAAKVLFSILDKQ